MDIFSYSWWQRYLYKSKNLTGKKKMKTKRPKFESWKIDKWFSKYKNLEQKSVEAVKKLREPWNVQGFATLLHW